MRKRYESRFEETLTKNEELFKGDDYYKNLYNDPDAMRELELYINNTSELYNQFKSIIKNIQRKIASNKYDHSLAPKLWGYWVEVGAKSYIKEFGSLGDRMQDMFPKKDRMILAQKLADYNYDDIISGNYD